jgi:hypothetical protein
MNDNNQNEDQQRKLSVSQRVKLNGYLARHDALYDPQWVDRTLLQRTLIKALLRMPEKQAPEFFQAQFDIDFVTPEKVAEFWCSFDRIVQAKVRTTSWLNHRKRGRAPSLIHICADCGHPLQIDFWLQKEAGFWKVPVDCDCGPYSVFAERWDLLLRCVSERKGLLLESKIC